MRLSMHRDSILLIGGIAGYLLVWISTSRYGAVITPDSVGYISVARNLAAGHGFIAYSGEWMTVWPPLYPLLLAVPQIVWGIDPVVTVRPLAAFLFGLVAIAGTLLLYRYVASRSPLTLFGLLMILLSPEMAGLALTALTEPLFILLVLLFLLGLDSYRRQPTSGNFGIVVVATMLACLTRYIGITLIATGGLIIFWLGKGKLLGRAWRAFSFAFLSFLPLFLWIYHNYTVSGTWMGPRDASRYALWQSLWFIGNTLFHLLLHPALWGNRGALIELVILTFIAGGALIFVILRSRRMALRNLLPVLKVIMPSLLWIIIYTAFLVYTSTTTAFDHISFRLLSPIYVPLVACGIAVADALYRSLQMQSVAQLAGATLHRTLVTKFTPLLLFKSSVVLVLSIYVLLHLSVLTTNIRVWRDQGAGGYSTAEWRESDLLAQLRQQPLPLDMLVYSNYPDVLYLLMDMKAMFSPQGRPYNSSADWEAVDRLRGNWPASQAYLIWFEKDGRADLHTPAELEIISQMKQVIAAQDGAIYLIAPQ